VICLFSFARLRRKIKKVRGNLLNEMIGKTPLSAKGVLILSESDQKSL